MKRAVIVFSVFLMGLVASARANTIGPSGCGSCLGSSYTLSYQTTANPSVFDIFLTVDATGFTNSNTDTLKAVALKVVPNASDISGVPSLIGSPIPSGFGSTVANGLNANGCAGGADGFFCSAASGNGVQVGHAGDVYTFEWAFTLASGSSLLTGLDAASVKALYVTSAGQQNGITSEDITLTLVPPNSPVPEPSSLLLLGTGMIGVASAVRRRLVRA